MSPSIAARRASTSFDPALGLAVPEDCPLEFETIPGAAFGLVVHGIEWHAPIVSRCVYSLQRSVATYCWCSEGRRAPARHKWTSSSAHSAG